MALNVVVDEAQVRVLETLRDAYSARQRSLNAVQAALKGTTSTLTKIMRALGDYAESGPLSDADQLTKARNAISTARLREDAIDPLAPALRRETKAIATAVAALKDALAAVQADPVDAVRLDHAVTALQAVAARDPELSDVLPALEEILHAAQNALGTTFGQALNSALAARGIEMGGRAPHFEAGRFSIEVDFTARSASISYGKEPVVRRVPLSVDAVIGAYTRATTTVTGRSVDSAVWMQQFHDAWVAAHTAAPRSDRANIVACYFQLVLIRQSKAFRAAPGKATFTDYSRAQFAHDFYEVTSRQHEAGGTHKFAAHEATKSQADSSDKSMWIVDGDSPHRGRYIGDITVD